MNLFLFSVALSIKGNRELQKEMFRLQNFSVIVRISLLKIQIHGEDLY